MRDSHGQIMALALYGTYKTVKATSKTVEVEGLERHQHLIHRGKLRQPPAPARQVYHLIIGVGGGGAAAVPRRARM